MKHGKLKRGAAVVRYAGKRGVVWRIKYLDADGIQVMETVGAERDGVTERQAQAELRERLVRVERKGYRKPGPLLFGDYAETWLAEGKTRRQWTPSTVEAYRNALNRLLEVFDRQQLGRIRPRDIGGYVRQSMSEPRKKTGKPLSASTVSLDLTVINLIYASAVREELVDANPCAGMERPKIVRHRWRILEPAEVNRVASEFTDERARVVFLVLIMTAIRNSELRSLRWCDVDLVANVLRVRDSKTETGERRIALTPATAEALWQLRRNSAYQGDDEYVFAHPEQGSRLDPTWFGREFRGALKRAGIDDYMRPFHDLRHSSLTNEAAAGSNPIALMTKAGHTSMQTTKLYLHLAGQVFHDEAAALEKRLGLGRKFYPSAPISDDPAGADSAQGADSEG